MPLDPLSLSPSLVDILCQLDHSDILNCRFLNRRFYQVIKRNQINMPRKEAALRITLWKDTVRYRIRVFLVPVGGSVHELHSIEDDQLVLSRYGKYSVASLFKFMFKNWPTLHYSCLPASERHQNIICKTNGIVEDIKLFFSFVFRRYYLVNMTIAVENSDEGVFDQSIALLGRIFDQSRCKLNTLTLVAVNPRLTGQFLRDLNYPACTMRFESTPTMFTEYINCIEDWQREHIVVVPKEELAMFRKTAFKIMEKWATGLIDIPSSLIFDELHGGEHFERPLREYAASYKGINQLTAGATDDRTMLILREDGKQMLATYAPYPRQFSMCIVTNH